MMSGDQQQQSATESTTTTTGGLSAVCLCLTSTDGSFYKLQHTQYVMYIGQDDDCHICLNNRSLEKRHAVIVFDEKNIAFKVKDLDTPSGTFVNETRLPTKSFVTLKSNDTIRFGYDSAIFRVDEIEERPNEEDPWLKNTQDCIVNRVTDPNYKAHPPSSSNSNKQSSNVISSTTDSMDDKKSAVGGESEDADEEDDENMVHYPGNISFTVELDDEEGKKRAEQIREKMVRRLTKRESGKLERQLSDDKSTTSSSDKSQKINTTPTLKSTTSRTTSDKDKKGQVKAKPKSPKLSTTTASPLSVTRPRPNIPPDSHPRSQGSILLTNTSVISDMRTPDQLTSLHTSLPPTRQEVGQDTGQVWRADECMPVEDRNESDGSEAATYTIAKEAPDIDLTEARSMIDKVFGLDFVNSGDGLQRPIVLLDSEESSSGSSLKITPRQSSATQKFLFPSPPVVPKEKSQHPLQTSLDSNVDGAMMRSDKKQRPDKDLKLRLSLPETGLQNEQNRRTFTISKQQEEALGQMIKKGLAEKEDEKSDTLKNEGSQEKVPEQRDTDIFLRDTEKWMAAMEARVRRSLNLPASPKPGDERNKLTPTPPTEDKKNRHAMTRGNPKNLVKPRVGTMPPRSKGEPRRRSNTNPAESTTTTSSSLFSESSSLSSDGEMCLDYNVERHSAPANIGQRGGPKRARSFTKPKATKASLLRKKRFSDAEMNDSDSSTDKLRPLNYTHKEEGGIYPPDIRKSPAVLPDIGKTSSKPSSSRKQLHYSSGGSNNSSNSSGGKLVHQKSPATKKLSASDTEATLQLRNDTVANELYSITGQQSDKIKQRLLNKDRVQRSPTSTTEPGKMKNGSNQGSSRSDGRYNSKYAKEIAQMSKDISKDLNYLSHSADGDSRHHSNRKTRSKRSMSPENLQQQQQQLGHHSPSLHSLREHEAAMYNEQDKSNGSDQFTPDFVYGTLPCIRSNRLPLAQQKNWSKIEPFDQLVLSSIHRLSDKLRRSAEMSCKKLRYINKVSGPTPVSIDEDIDIPLMKTSHRELAGIMQNLRIIEKNMEVIDRVIDPDHVYTSMFDRSTASPSPDPLSSSSSQASPRHRKYSPTTQMLVDRLARSDIGHRLLDRSMRTSSSNGHVST